MTQLERDLDLLDAHIGVFDRHNLRRVDWALLGLTLILAGLGLLNLYSASHGASAGTTSSVGSATWFGAIRDTFRGDFGKQALFLLPCLAIVALIVMMDYRSLVSLAPLLYVGNLVLLLLVLTVGEETRGAQRWLNLGFFRLQPSEFCKPVLVYALAWYCSRLGKRIRKLPYFILAFIITGVPCALVLIQPSLSSALALFPVLFVMLYAAGCRIWHLAAVVVLALIPVAMVAIEVRDYERLVREDEQLGPETYEEMAYPWGLKLEEYQIVRILTFLDPELDPQDEGYQTIQCRITVGSGQLKGKGFCKGTQTHLSYLPEHHTDFVFALLAEEWGFIGAATVVLLFLAFVLRAFGLAGACTDPAGSLLAVGCTTILAFHAFTNIAITVGLLPVTGMALPFFSYGRSFYLTTMICVGTLLSVHARKRFFE